MPKASAAGFTTRLWKVPVVERARLAVGATVAEHVVALAEARAVNPQPVGQVEVEAAHRARTCLTLRSVQPEPSTVLVLAGQLDDGPLDPQAAVEEVQVAHLYGR